MHIHTLTHTNTQIPLESIAVARLIANGSNNIDFRLPKSNYPQFENVIKVEGKALRELYASWLLQHTDDYPVYTYCDEAKHEFQSISDFACEGKVVINNEIIELDNVDFPTRIATTKVDR